MADDGSERKLFGNVVRNKTKYGSTTNPPPKFMRYVKHNVSRVDTLQGIALKYGATVEQIKRENKLWTNDSLFLRECLYIPVTGDNSHMVQDDWELLSSDEVRSRANSDLLTSPDRSHRGACENVTQGANGATGSENDTKNTNDAKVNNVDKSDKSNSSGMDFFSKYDSSIAALKSKVDKMEKDSSRDENLSELIPSSTRRHSDYTRATRTPPRRISVESPDSPVLVIRANMRSTKVQSAMKRSERANDDLFEL